MGGARGDLQPPYSARDRARGIAGREPDGPPGLIDPGAVDPVGHLEAGLAEPLAVPSAVCAETRLLLRPFRWPSRSVA